MKLRHLALFPLAAATVTALLLLFTPDPAVRALALRTEIETVKVLGIVGCVAAALAFEPGEYLRRSWLLQGSCFVFLIGRDVVFGLWIARDNGPAWSEYMQGAFVLFANLGTVAGVWMLSRAWHIAGIALPGSPFRREILRWTAVVVGLAIAGPQLAYDASRLAHGRIRSLVPIFSGVGDLFSLALVVPVLLTAVALRGGLLVWPWGLLTASMFGWLFYDGATVLGSFVDLDDKTTLVVTEVFRCLACTFCFSAGLAQRKAIAPDTSLSLRPGPASRSMRAGA
jgi:hypothetical protein